MSNLTTVNNPTYVNPACATEVPDSWRTKPPELHEQQHEVLCEVLPGWDLKPWRDFKYTVAGGLRAHHGVSGILFEMYRGRYGRGKGTGLNNVRVVDAASGEWRNVEQDESV